MAKTEPSRKSVAPSRRTVVRVGLPRHVYDAAVAEAKAEGITVSAVLRRSYLRELGRAKPQP